MTIGAVSAYQAGGETQGTKREYVTTSNQEKMFNYGATDSDKNKKEVSFWSKDWTAGNFVREKIGWEGLADWLDDKDKVCTDGKDDGKLGFGETIESFGKGLAGLVKGAMNHPIATVVTVGVGAAAVALTGGAILPVMVAAGATMGAGMVGVGAYKAATADTDAEAKQAWETIGTGTFTVGASALGAKSALKQANAAGVKNAIATNNPIKNVVNCFKSSPRALKVSGWHIDSKFVIANVHKEVNNYIKEIAANSDEITPEIKATVKQLRDDEAAIVNGIKRSINDGYYAPCDKYLNKDWRIIDVTTGNAYPIDVNIPRNRISSNGYYKIKPEDEFSSLADIYRSKDFASLAQRTTLSELEVLSNGQALVPNRYGGYTTKYSNYKDNPISRYYAKQKINNLALEAGEKPEVWLGKFNNYVTQQQNNINRITSNTKDLLNFK